MKTAGKRTPTLPDGMKSETGNFMHENEFNRDVVARLKVILERCGFGVFLTAPTDEDISLKERVRRANEANADAFCSVHANAYLGKWGNAQGVSTFHYYNSVKGKELANIVHKHLASGTKQVNRGVKQAGFYVIKYTKMEAILAECAFMDNLREAKLLLSDSFRQECAEDIARGFCEYYKVPYIAGDKQSTYTVRGGDTLSKIAEKFGTTVENLVRLNDIKDPSLIKVGQVIKLREEPKFHVVGKGDTLSKIAEKYDSTVKELCSINSIKNPNIIEVGQKIYLTKDALEKREEPEEKLEDGTKILGNPEATMYQAMTWAKSKGASKKFIDVAKYFWKYGELTGIRPEILYSQSAKETNFGKYTGAVKESMNNFAGIKIKNPTGDKTEDHETFDSPEDGVRALFNHISAYVGVDPVGKPHDRYHVVKTIKWAGRINFVEELGGKYAPNPDYGKSIVRDYMTKLIATKAGMPKYSELEKEIQELEKQVTNLTEDLAKKDHMIDNLKDIIEDVKKLVN